jgi:hypothetical protein
MIILRRADERLLHQLRKQKDWLTFHPQGQPDLLSAGFTTLESLSENLLPPRASAPRHLDHDAEMVTYVRSGALAYKDSIGRSGVIQSGEFQSMTAGRGIRRREKNASRTNWAHIFQVRLRPSESGLEPGLEQKRFSAAERRGRLCVIASPDGRSGSLPMHQDALIYSALLDPGQHMVHEISPGRSVWLHLVQGEASLSDLVLRTGDGVGVRGERALSLTARQGTEILLLDLGEQHLDSAQPFATIESQIPRFPIRAADSKSRSLTAVLSNGLAPSSGPDWFSRSPTGMNGPSVAPLLQLTFPRGHHHDCQDSERV